MKRHAQGFYIVSGILSAVFFAYIQTAYATTQSFTTVGTTSWTVPSGVVSVHVLVVAGGGGGGGLGDRTGGGGGGGGVVDNTSYTTTPGASITVTVGAGGASNTAGSNSVFGTITAIGGGAGGQYSSGATSGGSGGGAYHNASDSGKSGTSGQGNAGGNGYDSGDGSNGTFTGGGGGGGSAAGAAGVSSKGGNGGAGYTSNITGSSVVYAGGGGGGCQHLGSGSCTGGTGGTGGGGAGGAGTNSTYTAGTAGTANTGGGGGGTGGGGATVAGGAGGSGVVIISYTVTITKPTVSTNFAGAVDYHGGTLVGSITDNGGSDATQTGFAYSTNSTLSSSVSTTTLGSFSGTGSFNQRLDSLAANTTYYFRAYATNSSGTGYGSILNFTTGNSTVSRSIQLFEGGTVKFFGGTLKLYPTN